MIQLGNIRFTKDTMKSKNKNENKRLDERKIEEKYTLKNIYGKKDRKLEKIRGKYC